ncbi:MAG: O-antigen ligase family protein [Litorimonas sp.]
MDGLLHKLPNKVVWLALCLMPFLAIAGGLGIAPVGFLIGLIGWAVLVTSSQAKKVIAAPWFLALCAMLIWCCVAQLWSPYKQSGFLGNPVLLGIIVVGYCGVIPSFKNINPNAQNILCHLFLASSVLGIGLMFIDILSGFGLSTLVDPVNPGEVIHKRQGDAEQNLGRGLLTYTQFLPAIILMFIVKFKQGWLTIIPMVFILLLTAHLNRLSLPLFVIIPTLLIMGLTWKFPQFMIKAVFCLLILLVICGPLTGFLSGLLSDEQLAELPLSVEHRLRMWAYAWERILENPWLGNGFDASRSYQDTFISKEGYEIVIVSLHTHNAPVQIWLEIGMIGAVLSALTLVMLMKPALRFSSNSARASALAGTVMAIALFGATTIGVWQFWWWGSMFIAIGMLHLIPAAPSQKIQ